MNASRRGRRRLDRPGCRTDASDGDLGKVLGFMQKLWELDHHLQSASKQMKLRLGVTGPQRLAIRLVGRHPGISAAHLAEALRIDPSTLTGVCQRLQAEGLLERRTDPNDGRRAAFFLTAAGQSINRRRVATVEDAVRRVIERTPPEYLLAATKVLEQIVQELPRTRTPDKCASG